MKSSVGKRLIRAKEINRQLKLEKEAAEKKAADGALQVKEAMDTLIRAIAKEHGTKVYDDENPEKLIGYNLTFLAPEADDQELRVSMAIMEDEKGKKYYSIGVMVEEK